MQTFELDTFIAARALIAHPANWIQGKYAATNNGDQVLPKDKEATCFCATGAIRRANLSTDNGSDEYLRRVFHNNVFTPSMLRGIEIRRILVSWNDETDRTHAEVLAAFDMVIDKLTKRFQT